MLSQLNPTSIVPLASAFLLGVFFVYVYLQKRQEYLLAWSIGWFLLAAHFVPMMLPPQITVPKWAWSVNEWILAIAALSFYCSARLYGRLTVHFRAIFAVAAALAVWAVAFDRGWTQAPLGLSVTLTFFFVARTFWQEGQKQESRADILLAITFVFWGLIRVASVLQPRFGGRFANVSLVPLVALPELFAGVLMVMAVYEEERRRVERNMLALSNLNLATSSFVGGEIQKMLAQALDRVLNVVRIPAGALCLHYGDSEGPTSVVVHRHGRRVLRRGRSRMILTNTSSISWLASAASWSFEISRSDSDYRTLEKEEQFQHVRKLLLEQGLRTVVGISLQAKERVFGVLLLGTPDNRNFTAAELRLLLALGHQIGMAVENSYLIQQTARRSEELHILNEIGRALSSTLEPDILFERIYSEIRRLLDVSSFFIAFYDGKADEVRFEIEVVDGERQPKRTRPPGNHLVEYVVRERQPLLIRDHFHEETARLGFEPAREAGSICVVPLILYDRAIGVMAVHSPNERAFDEGHVELLRVLASEAGIAIENARLFAEEQKKSRHLTLVNNISSHAITTLNPEEMLAKIASEIENGLTYDHIGIAMLDYSAKELVIQAEAGARHDALGRRILLGEGLVGQVARTGQIAIVREVNATTPRLIVPGSVSAIALPVSYADSLLGVLYVESSEKCELPG